MIGAAATATAAAATAATAAADVVGSRATAAATRTAAATAGRVFIAENAAMSYGAGVRRTAATARSRRSPVRGQGHPAEDIERAHSGARHAISARFAAVAVLVAVGISRLAVAIAAGTAGTTAAANAADRRRRSAAARSAIAAAGRIKIGRASVGTSVPTAVLPPIAAVRTVRRVSAGNVQRAFAGNDKRRSFV